MFEKLLIESVRANMRGNTGDTAEKEEIGIEQRYKSLLNALNEATRKYDDESINKKKNQRNRSIHEKIELNIIGKLIKKGIRNYKREEEEKTIGKILEDSRS